MQVFIISHRTMAALSNNVHHHSFHHPHSGNGNNSMVRKHRTMQRRRQYQQRVIAWWIKLTIPPLLLWLIYYFGTSSILRTDDKKHNNNDKGNDATKKKKSSSDSGSTIALWMQQQEEERTGDTVTSSSTSSSSAHCIANIVASIAADDDGKVGGSLDVGRDEAATILQQSLACFVPSSVVVVNKNDEKEESSSTKTTTTTRTTTTTSIRSVWIAGSTAAAGYGNQKHQSYPALLQQAFLSSSSSDNSNARGNTIAVDVGRDATEFPLAWCRRTGGASGAGRNQKNKMVLYDFQDDVYHFNTTRLRDFVAYVQPTILIMRLSNDHDISSQHEIVQYLSSLVEVSAPAAPEQEPSSGSRLSTTTTSSSVRAVYVIDVSSLLNNNDDNGAVAAAVFGVAHSPDRLHPHHLTLTQHERVAQIVRWLMRHHGFDDDHPDGDNDESSALQDHEQLDGSSSSNGDTASFWHCASGFGDATTTGRTAGSLHFVVATDDQQKKNNRNNSITLATVLPDCCGKVWTVCCCPTRTCAICIGCGTR
jgi:hypothetical protein